MEIFRIFFLRGKEKETEFFDHLLYLPGLSWVGQSLQFRFKTGLSLLVRNPHIRAITTAPRFCMSRKFIRN